jgi:hypothetical protein
MNGIKQIEYLTFNDKLYQVYRRFPIDGIKKDHVLDVRDAWFCDTVLKTSTRGFPEYVFLRECPDAEIIEEIPNDPQSEK